MATGDIRIDSLLALPRNSLATNLPLGRAIEITYSFSGYSTAQVSAVTSMLAEVSTLVGVNFRQVDNGALLVYGYKSDGPTLADGSTGSGSMQLKTDGTGAIAWLNPKVAEMQNLDSGYGRQVALHETAHALGLKHPGEYSGNDSGPYLPDELATANHTIMAYNGGSTEHLGDFDILALQYLYGAAGPATQAPLTLISVDAASTSGSYFNDLFTLDISNITSSVRVTGLTGIDQLQVNLASSETFFQGKELDQVIYKKADGTYAGIFLDSVERIQFTDRTLGLDIDGNAGQAYRLYKAAFDRVPDKGGLGYWIGELDGGATLLEIAAKFITSAESIKINGANPTNLAFAKSMYQHVLGRAPDQGGLAWWVDQLDSNTRTRSDVLVGFSESSENQIALTGQTQSGIEFLPA